MSEKFVGPAGRRPGPSRFPFLVLFTCLACIPSAFARPLNTDTAFSEISFNVSNWGVNTVYGRFDKYTSQIEFDPQAPEQSKVHVVIQAASVNTENQKRDEHLRTADFFDVANFPELTFDSQSITRSTEGYVMTGLLLIKGQSHPVSIPFTFTTATANNKIILHAQGRTQIDRHDYGINYGSNFSVGKTVSIHLSVAASE